MSIWRELMLAYTEIFQALIEAPHLRRCPSLGQCQSSPMGIAVTTAFILFPTSTIEVKMNRKISNALDLDTSRIDCRIARREEEDGKGFLKETCSQVPSTFNEKQGD
jgi:hypothetical protein